MTGNSNDKSRAGRREGERRLANDPNYTGPERRVGTERRNGMDRRKPAAS